jgi:hypothetical protein
MRFIKFLFFLNLTFDRQLVIAEGDLQIIWIDAGD